MQKLLKITNKLSHKLIISILFFSGIITLILSAIQVSIEYKRDVSYLETQIEQIKTNFTPPLRQAIWQYNHDLIRIQLENIINFRDIEYAAVYDHQQLIASDGKNIKSTRELEIPILYEYNNEIRTIGKLIISSSYVGIYNRFFQRLGIILASSATKTFFTSVFMFFLFKTMVIRHLEQLSHFLRAFNVEDELKFLSFGLPDRTSGEGDELNEIENKVNTLVSAVHESYEKSQKEIKILSGLLPICSHCKMIRDDHGDWKQMEYYIHEHSEAKFSHSICPKCAKELYPDLDIYEKT